MICTTESFYSLQMDIPKCSGVKVSLKGVQTASMTTDFCNVHYAFVPYFNYVSFAS